MNSTRTRAARRVAHLAPATGGACARSSTAVARGAARRLAGATITRAPARRARQHRSMSSEPGDVVGVEAAELVEQVGAHEHRRVRHEEHVAHAVVLFLVDLVRARSPRTGTP